MPNKFLALFLDKKYFLKLVCNGLWKFWVLKIFTKIFFKEKKLHWTLKNKPSL